MPVLPPSSTPDTPGASADVSPNRPARAMRTDGEATYNRILEAAGELIGQNGYAETTSKMIAARAGVDLASINYHFGNRGGLYQTLLAEAHSRLISVDYLRTLDARDIPAPDKLRHLIAFFIDSAAVSGPWPGKVLGRELLSPSSHFSTFQQTEVLPKIGILLKILSELTGMEPHDPALLRCLISIATPGAMLLVFQNSGSPLAGRLLPMPREVLIEHLYRFAIGGLEKVCAHPVAP